MENIKVGFKALEGMKLIDVIELEKRLLNLILKKLRGRFKMPINWSELYKVRLASSIPEMDKHDIIKLLVVRKILRKYKRKHWLRIYTEFSLNNGSNLKPDVYMENIKDKSVICYEIQKECDKKYIQDRVKKYNAYEVYNFTVDLVIIPLKGLSDNIQELNKQLDKYVV